jgi:hypothetical protein
MNKISLHKGNVNGDIITTLNTIKDKDKKLRLTLTDVLCPMVYLKTYNKQYNQIDSYLRTKLSLDNLMKVCEEIDILKTYVFNKDELYVVENLDKIRCRMLSYSPDENFDYSKYKGSYKRVLSNIKFQKAIETK